MFLPEQAFASYVRDIMRQDEARLRELLRAYVSEIEPAVVRGPGGVILGLCDAAAKVGDTPFVFKG